LRMQSRQQLRASRSTKTTGIESSHSLEH
jgi:hypothetical protein